jgi:hypothetical protein
MTRPFLVRLLQTPPHCATFPAEVLADWDVEARRPDDFLTFLPVRWSFVMRAPGSGRIGDLDVQVIAKDL